MSTVVYNSTATATVDCSTLTPVPSAAAQSTVFEETTTINKTTIVSTVTCPHCTASSTAAVQLPQASSNGTGNATIPSVPSQVNGANKAAVAGSVIAVVGAALLL